MKAQSQRPKILWIKADQLHPLNSGGKIRTYNMLKVLKEHFHISYFCMGGRGTNDLEHMEEYSDKQHVVPYPHNISSRFTEAKQLLLSLLTSRLPYVIYKYTDRRTKESLGRVIADGGFDIIVCDFLSLSANLLDLPKLENTGYVVFQHNVESRIWERHYRTASNWIWKLMYKIQWKRFLKSEEETCRWFDGVIAVSEADEKEFNDSFSLNNVLGHVETGVDIEYFSPRGRAPENREIVFLGSMDWTPNIDGITEFASECWPKILDRVPDARLIIVGRNPAPAVLQLAEQHQGICVTGTVADVRPYLANAALSIVPLRVGGGTRIKIYEAMAMGVPVVSTYVGAEGLPLNHRESIMLAADWPSLADATVELMLNESLASTIARNGASLVRATFSWSEVTQEFIDMLERVRPSGIQLTSKPYNHASSERLN